uniref:Somatotropin n=1 Tax=Kryptolebias marmoratus TaxID=37003 RepID=A0A3Q3B5W3_KRYMA
MDRAVLLLSVMCAAVSSQPITDSQRLFSIAVSRVQHLHLLAQRLFSDFESSLQTEEQRQLNKIFLQDFCNSDYIISPIDKHETQRSSVLKLLSISYRLVESWEFPSRSLSGGSAPRNQISPKLSELKTGILLLIRVRTHTDHLYRHLSPPAVTAENLRNAGLLQERHVETYLTVAKCRLSPEANCTL